MGHLVGTENEFQRSCATEVRHTSAQFEDDQETDRLAPATTVDLFAEAPLLDRLSLVVRGENLLDEQIVTRNSRGGMQLLIL